MREIKKRLRKILDQDRYWHSLRVQKTAEKLARFHGVDVKKASLAGLLHDCARWMTSSEMVAKAKCLGYKPSPIEILEPKLLHAYLSASEAKHSFGILDPEILQAIERHTLGAKSMHALDKIIYLADHIEPARNFPGVALLRKLVFQDMDAAIVISTSAMIKFLIKMRRPISMQTIQTRNYYLNERN